MLNAYFSLGHSPGGFRVWWRRWHDDSDETLDNTHLMRLAVRFARRVRGWAAAHDHYSFHIMDPAWGHLTIKMSGHPPFGAQVILNGHEYVACAAQTAGIGFAKEGNCFTRLVEPRLAQVADTLSQPGTVGRLSQVIDRWIYTACLCFGLDLTEQARSGWGRTPPAQHDRR